MGFPVRTTLVGTRMGTPRPFAPIMFDPGRSYRAGRLVTPTTDSGWATYNEGSRLFLPAATNLYVNPSFETDSNANGMANGFTAVVNTTGSITYTQVAGRLGGLAQRVQYTGIATDTAKNIQMYITRSAAASFAPGDPATVLFYVKGSTSGITFVPRINWYKSDAAYISGTSGAAITATAEWVLVSLTVSPAPALTDNMGFEFRITGVDEGDTIDLSFDDIFPQKSAVLEPYFDGTYANCAWTGTAHESTSTRTASDLVLTDYVQITSAGVVAAGAKVAYARNPSSTYYGPVVVTDTAKSAGWQSDFAAYGAQLNAIWNSLVSGDMLIPLASDGIGYVKK